MSAVNVARTLGDARKEGPDWRCRCPLHGGRSLIVSDGSGGQLLVWCFGGCDGRAVLAELRLRGLLDGPGYGYARAAPITPLRDAARAARSLAIWQEAQPAARTIAETYLDARVGRSDLPATLRFHAHCPHPSGARLPAMVALVEHVEHGPIGIHRTYLQDDGGGKAYAAPNKASLGPVGGGAVRLGPAESGHWLAVAEGIETTLSIMLACALSGWAALSAGGMRSLILPLEVNMVLICADNDANGVGQRASRAAAERFLAEGRRVRIATPRASGADFNDVLRGTALTQNLEATHVAA